MTARAQHVLTLLKHGDPYEAIAALTEAQRDGYRFTFAANGEGVTVMAVPS